MKWRTLPSGVRHLFATALRVRAVCGALQANAKDEPATRQVCLRCYDKVRSLNEGRRPDRPLKIPGALR